MEIVITPPHMQLHVLADVSAGMLATITPLAPGDHGVVVTGTHGCGVNTPWAADVADATCGFDNVVHMPNGAMFTFGL